MSMIYDSDDSRFISAIRSDRHFIVIIPKTKKEALAKKQIGCTYDTIVCAISGTLSARRVSLNTSNPNANDAALSEKNPVMPILLRPICFNSLSVIV